MYMEKSLNLGKDLVGWMDGRSSSLLLCDVKGGEVPLLVFSHQECKLAESLRVVPVTCKWLPLVTTISYSATPTS